MKTNTENTCKYCGKKLTQHEIKHNRTMCGTCGNKSPLIPRFIKARDNLCQALGMKRMV